MNVSRKTAKLFLEGDKSAFEDIYVSYRKLIYFIISNYVKSKEDCDDVYQNIFAKLYERRNECKSSDGLHYYLIKTAKSQAINFAKKSIPQTLGCEETLSEDEKPFEYFLPYGLNEKERAIIGYRLGFSLAWKDVVELTGVPVSTAKSIYSKALQKIKKEYEK